MLLKKITLRNFRNIKSSSITFAPRVNYFSGNNAQGKTNMLEAVYLFSVAKSFRARSDGEMVNFNSPGVNPDGSPGGDIKFASLDLIMEDNRGMRQIEITLFDNSKKIISINGVKLERYSDLVGCLKTVLFTPSHLSIVTDSPSVRREFLDIAISQIDRIYLHDLQEFGKILKERNKLLKDIGDAQRIEGKWPDGAKESLDVYSGMLANVSCDILARRLSYIERLGVEVKKVFFDMTNDHESPEIKYVTSIPGLKGAGGKTDVPTVAELTSLYIASYDRDISLGATVFGIHKDDMEFYLNSHPVKNYGSQGQQRSFALALKLGEGELIKEEIGEYPVYLFDDVLSELDSSRREYLMAKLSPRQVLITSCEFEDSQRYSDEAFKDSYLFRVLDGNYIFF